MSKEKKLFNEAFTIRSSEVRPDGKAKVQTLCDLMQETAGNHALELNFDVTQLRENERTWMLNRLDVHVKRYPEWRETVTVRTWPSGGDNLRAYRDFLILDSSETVVVRALSYWLMIDLRMRRPVRIPQEVLEMGPGESDHVLPVKKSRPSPPDEADTVKLFEVRRSDLDVNEHVNNVQFVEWISETLSSEDLIRLLDIEFKAECGYGDVIEVGTGRSDGRIHSNVRLNGEDKILATAEIMLAT